MGRAQQEKPARDIEAAQGKERASSPLFVVLSAILDRIIGSRFN
jgi:hypothetical protein